MVNVAGECQWKPLCNAGSRDIIHGICDFWHLAPHPVNKLTVIECELCNSEGGRLLWRDEFARVVLVDSDEYPGFCRVILNRHVKEMTELSIAERAHLMDRVFAVEEVVREFANPDKINLASLGNAVPHLHWHVIPRWRDDQNFPQPIWAGSERVGVSRPRPDADDYSRRLRELVAR